jgi:hypothetical protein
MECYACENEATRQCRRCARVYCELHGGDLCGECLNPVSTLPSFNLYRGSLLALLIATAVALWLLVRPPGSGDGEAVVISDATPTAIETQARTPTQDGETPEARTATPAASTTPGTPGPNATPTVSGPETYTVVDGDTLLGIAERFAPAGVAPLAYAQQIADASGLASIDTPINPGQTLVLP